MILATQGLIMILNYLRYSDKTELFIARVEAQRQTKQLQTILNQIENGILISDCSDNKCELKYHN